jgi:hypothetical protein
MGFLYFSVQQTGIQMNKHVIDDTEPAVPVHLDLLNSIL